MPDMALELTNEIDLGGTIYISSKRAADISGYAQDYIGQLARSGQIEAKRISGLWYILEDSLTTHKERADQYIPTPPQRSTGPIDLDTSISFDGRDYVSAQRAAKITGYSNDYVSQLARTGKIVSRQIGNRWYVDREALVEHKRYNDSLLAALQSESVGIKKQMVGEIAERPAEISRKRGIHFNYIANEDELMPTLEKKTLAAPEESQEEFEEETPRETTNQIPIRVIQDTRSRKAPEERLEKSTTAYLSAPKMAMFMIVFVGFIGSVFAAVSYMRANKDHTSNMAAVETLSNEAGLLALVTRALSKELIFKR